MVEHRYLFSWVISTYRPMTDKLISVLRLVIKAISRNQAHVDLRQAQFNEFAFPLIP